MEDARPQHQHSTIDPLTCEIQEETRQAQPQQPPNDLVEAEKEQDETEEDEKQRIDPKLLRAIVNRNLMGFKKILGIEEASNLSLKKEASNDIESIQVTNGGNSHLCRVTCEEKNTALHVVAGIIRKSSPMVPSHKPGLLIFARPISDSPAIFLVFAIFYFLIKIISKLFKASPRKRSVDLEIADIIYRKDPTLLNRANCAKETPLHCAAKAGKLQMVSLLVNFAREEGPQKLEEVLRARNQIGETALHEAARFGYSDVVEELLRADEKYLACLVDNNEISSNSGQAKLASLACLVDNNGISPLYLAVAAGYLDVVLVLTAHDRQPSYAGPDKQTVLHAAIMRQEENIMRAILEWKLTLAEKTDEAKNTPLHYATLIGNTYAVKQLLLKDTRSVYKVNLNKSYPVHLAAEAGHVKVIKELLKRCPDVGELLDQEKRNFLHVAVHKKRIRVIRLACEEGINANVINAKDKDGYTPLHLAVISSDTEICAILSENKRADPNIRNKVGLTPLDISASLHDHQYLYSLTPQSVIHRTLVTRGAFQNPCKILHNLVKMDDGASVDCPNGRERQEMRNGEGVSIEKESTKYENMSKSLITGAVLIASTTFVAILTASGVYKGDNTSDTSIIRHIFMAFVIADMLAFISAIVCTIWLLHSVLSNFHLKYREFYFQRCTLLLYGAINFFILAFGLGGYFAIAPLSKWLALVILLVSGIAILWNIFWNPNFVPLILLAPYTTTEELHEKILDKTKTILLGVSSSL